MIATKYPNRDALYASYTIYRDAMRRFIVECLQKNGDTSLEQLISMALNKLPRYQEYPVKPRNESDAIVEIDINNFPDIIETYWESPICFSEEFDSDRAVLNETQRIKEGRLHWAHPGIEDADRAATLKLLWIVAEILEKINGPDAKREVETIRDQLCPNESEVSLAVMSNQWETAQAEVTTLKTQLVAMEERLAVAEAEKTAAEEQLADISEIVTAESFRKPGDSGKTDDTSDQQLDSEPLQMLEEVPSTLEVGQWVNGKVKNITYLGAFVDLGGIDGLIRIPDLTWKRINDPSEVVSEGDEVKVKVINIDQETEKGKTRVDLRLKPKPWEDKDIEADYPIGSKVRGTVANFEPYGVFLELEEGLRGMIHKSELSWKRHEMTPSDFHQGQELEAKVINISKDDRRISLSLKQLEPNPWEFLKEKYPDGTKITGRVLEVRNFGLIVEVESGFDGRLLISTPVELSEGDEVEVIIARIDVEKQQILLGSANRYY